MRARASHPERQKERRRETDRQTDRQTERQIEAILMINKMAPADSANYKCIS